MGPFEDSEYISERARADAGMIVDQLLTGQQGVDVVDDEYLVLSDVDEDVTRYTEQLQWLDYLGFPAPATRLPGKDQDDFVPMDLGLLGPPAEDGLSDGVPEVSWLHESDQLLRQRLDRDFTRASTDIEDFTAVPVPAAREKFSERLRDFVSIRLSAVRLFQRYPMDWGEASPLQLPRRSGGQLTTTPGCSFEVWTNSSGLRVHWTGAYLTTANFFSSPTSPATSILQSGAYRFGVDGGAYRKIKWDHTVVTLPGNPSIHLNF